MRRCQFCDRWFRNKQAVRAHLRFCAPYLQARADGTSPTPARLVERTYYRCAGCADFVADREDVHALYRGRCPKCGYREWTDMGTHWVPDSA
ncbi:MAG: hypothetical protein D6689_22720 [Deltaproteobacteria bacterium]|nr:MAG: hypothetical protein D6689_22720 [Deltaproteobacteria bacterium]